MPSTSANAVENEALIRLLTKEAGNAPCHSDV